MTIYSTKMCTFRDKNVLSDTFIIRNDEPEMTRFAKRTNDLSHIVFLDRFHFTFEFATMLPFRIVQFHKHSIAVQRVIYLSRWNKDIVHILILRAQECKPSSILT